MVQTHMCGAAASPGVNKLAMTRRNIGVSGKGERKTLQCQYRLRVGACMYYGWRRRTSEKRICFKQKFSGGEGLRLQGQQTQFQQQHRRAHFCSSLIRVRASNTESNSSVGPEEEEQKQEQLDAKSQISNYQAQSLSASIQTSKNKYETTNVGLFEKKVSNTNLGNNLSEIEPKLNEESVNSKALEMQDIEENRRWDEWKAHFERVLDGEAECISLEEQLNDAVKNERYEAASTLKEALIELKKGTDIVGSIQEKMKAAVEEERYRDAARYRDEGGQMLIGWWAGRAIPIDPSPDSIVIPETPYGHLVRISCEHGRYVAKAYIPQELLDNHGEGVGSVEELNDKGSPVFEVYVRPFPSTQKTEISYDMQACVLRYAFEKSDEDHQSDILNAENLYSVTFDGDDIGEDEDNDEDDDEDGIDDESADSLSSNSIASQSENLQHGSWRIDNLGIGIDIFSDSDYIESINSDEDDIAELKAIGHIEDKLSFGEGIEVADDVTSVEDLVRENNEDDQEDGKDNDDETGNKSNLSMNYSANLSKIEVNSANREHVGDSEDDVEYEEKDDDDDEDGSFELPIGISEALVEIKLDDVPSIEEAVIFASGAPSIIVRERGELSINSHDSFVFEKLNQNSYSEIEDEKLGRLISNSISNVLKREDPFDVSTKDGSSQEDKFDDESESEVNDENDTEMERNIIDATKEMLSNRIGPKCLSSLTNFTRIPESACSGSSYDPFEGLFVGTFGPHGPEVIHLKRGYWGVDRVDDINCITAFKVTGDTNVPAGAPSFRFRAGREDKLLSSSSSSYPSEIGLLGRYKGEGRVARHGYEGAMWVKGECVHLDGKMDAITGGASIGFAWLVPGERRYMILFHRLNLT